MARRKDKRRRARHTAPQAAQPPPARAPEELIPVEQREAPAPERLSAPGGTAAMVAFLVASAAIAGLLLSGWTPRSVETTPGAGSSPGATTPGTTPSPPAPIGGLGSIPAKNVFGAYCGICHTLAAVGSVGTVGPNLDQLRPTKAEVLRAIRVGGRGTGQMPPEILRGKPADRVAAYVASVAGS
jgi:mono/diheme cytochrome c family protein